MPTNPTAPLPGQTDPAIIRNCIIAHIDHGKSTLADRMLQLTGVVDERSARAQYLDRMDIERERGITIKSQAVRMPWTVAEGNEQGAEPGTYVLNMIDTRAVDFTYEVSRSLEACGRPSCSSTRPGDRGPDARQPLPGDGADRPTSSPCSTRSTCRGQPRTSTPPSSPGWSAAIRTRCCGSARRPASASHGLLDEIVGRRRRRSGTPTGRPALIFDSVYDTYRGVVTYVRVVDGSLTHRDRIKMMSTGATRGCLGARVINPEQVKAGELGVGEVGYLITGVRTSASPGSATRSPSTTAPPRRSAATAPQPDGLRGLYPIDGAGSGTCARRWRSSS